MKKFIMVVCFMQFFVAINQAIAIEEILPDEINNESVLLTPQVEIESESKMKLYLEKSDYLTGNWGGLRSKLEEKGINIQSSYWMNGFGMKNRTTGGKKGTYHGVYNLSVELDSEKMGFYKGGKFFALYQNGKIGVSPSRYLNTYSYMNIYDPAENLNQMSEYWYEHNFKDDKFSLKIGKQDSNADFQALDSGFKFLNYSFAAIPNTPIPTYPIPQMGVRVKYNINEKLYIQNGFYDGTLDYGSGSKGFFNGKNGYIDLLEVGYLPSIKGYGGKYMVGGWFKTGDFEHLNSGENLKNNNGAYVAFEQKIYHKPDYRDQGLNLIGRFGYAPNDRNAASNYYAAGLVYKGLIPKRNEDETGVGFASYQFSQFLKDGVGATAERVVEIFYRIKLTNFLTIQPDLQYIVRPSGLDRNSWAIGIVSILTF